MTKKYILLKDQIQSTVGTSEFPPSSTAVKNALDGKVAIDQGVTQSGKFLKVGTDGKVTLGDVAAQEQADWDETSTSAPSYIQNKPTALSEFSNDENFQTDEEVATSIATHNAATDAHSDIRTAIDDEVERAEGEEQELQAQIDAIEARTDVVDVVATKAALNAYDTSKITLEDIVKVLADESQSGKTSYYRWTITSPATVPAWVLVGSVGPYYTKSEADGYFVPQQRTINTKPLTGNVTLGASDVGALPEDTTLADLDDDATHRVVTDDQIDAWDAKQDALTFDDAPTSGSANPVKSGGVYTALGGKVDKESGKTLVETTKISAYDEHIADDSIHVTSSDKTGWDNHVASTENPHQVTKAQVGLGNCDNTSDANKPISTATQAALNGKVDEVEGVVAIGKDSTGFYFNIPDSQ